MQSRFSYAGHSRGQSSGMIVFALILAIGGLVWGLLDVGMTQIFTSTLGQTNNAQATGIIETRQAIWANLPLFFIAFAGILIIARAAVQSRA